MMKTVALALLVASASAFAPSAVTSRAGVQMSAEAPADRRAVLSTIASVGALSALAPAAFADGAVSAATVARARGIYGARISALKEAAAKGDLGAFEAERGVFDIFASSGYARAASSEKKAVKAGVKSIYAAVKAGDKAALKTSYDAFTKDFVPKDTNERFGALDVTKGQGYSNDYDWKARTSKGVIYQR